MYTRLRTSKESKERMEFLNKGLKFSSYAILLRYAIAKSINYDDSVEDDDMAIVKNNSGFDISRSTLFGENEIIYKLLMNKVSVDDDELFFPILTNKHIERGLKLLEREYKLTGNKDKFIADIISKLDI